MPTVTVTVTIDNRQVQVQDGTTVLDAAGRLGIEIPSLCHMDGFPPFSSCMVCLVEDSDSKRLLPACSAPVTHGMVIETDNRRVREARRDMLELLLLEHVGDCESPCMRACPVSLDVPVILRRLKAGSARPLCEAHEDRVPLVSVLAHICPAPCEKACRRKAHDEAVSIRLALRAAALQDSGIPTEPALSTPGPSGRKVAIVGAGAAGLSAANYLSSLGHACTVFDSREAPGGALRYEIPEGRLPRNILDGEIDRIRSRGVMFHMKTEVGRDVLLDELLRRFDAVALATGTLGPKANFGTAMTERGIRINRKTFETSIPGVFAGGAAVRTCRIAARAVADGRAVAQGIHRYFNGNETYVSPEQYDCRMGILRDGEIEQFLKGVSYGQRTLPARGITEGFSIEEAAREAGRCLHCDCGKKKSCALREYARAYAVKDRFRISRRVRFERMLEHPKIVFEPSKCIKCGRCVRISEAENEAYGLSFNGRSFNLQVRVPFDEPLSNGLDSSAIRCAQACPTGALTEKDTSVGPESRQT
jgi:NADPH-dependent glutamate synthase beta subunit-like oxidoreductase